MVEWCKKRVDGRKVVVKNFKVKKKKTKIKLKKF